MSPCRGNTVTIKNRLLSAAWLDYLGTHCTPNIFIWQVSVFFYWCQPFLLFPESISMCQGFLRPPFSFQFKWWEWALLIERLVFTVLPTVFVFVWVCVCILFHREHSNGVRVGLHSGNLLLRSCTIRNTETVVGIVVYAGKLAVLFCHIWTLTVTLAFFQSLKQIASIKEMEFLFIRKTENVVSTQHFTR